MSEEIKVVQDAQELLQDEFGFEVWVRDSLKCWYLICRPLGVDVRIEKEPGDTPQTLCAAAAHHLSGEMDRKEATHPGVRGEATAARSARRHQEAAESLARTVQAQHRRMVDMEERVLLIEAENKELRQLSSGGRKDVPDGEFEDG